IGDQSRPRIFDLNIQRSELLYDRVIEVNERITAHGEVLHKPDLSRLRNNLQQTYDDGLRACAIVLMHAYRFPEHEEQIAQLARDIGFEQISTSHRCSPRIKLIGRGDTTVVDAYLSPILHRYAQRVARALEDTRLMFMKSDGGLADTAFFD